MFTAWTKPTTAFQTADCFVYGGSGPHQLSSIVGSYNGATNPSFSHDANGNTTGGANRTASFTSFNMAASMTNGSTSVALGYSAWHGRYKMCAPDCTAPSTTTYYLPDPATGAYSEKVVSGATTTWRDYIVADGQIVALRSKTGASVTMLYIVADHLGSTAVVTDTATPMTVERDGYDAWGHRRNINGTPDPSCTLTSQTNRGYTGQEMLDSQCLINMNARVYDPTLARFQSADSVVPNPAYGQAYNRYAYVYGNPLALTDPSGHSDYEPPQPNGDCSDNNSCPPYGPGTLIACQNGCGGYGEGYYGSQNISDGERGRGTGRDTIETVVVVHAKSGVGTDNQPQPQGSKAWKCTKEAWAANGFSLLLDVGGFATGAIPGASAGVLATSIIISSFGAVYSAQQHNYVDAGTSYANILGIASQDLLARGGYARFASAIPWFGLATNTIAGIRDIIAINQIFDACMSR